MSDNWDETIATLDKRITEGLALLPEAAQAALEGAPVEFRRALGSALFDIHSGDDDSDYGRGMHFGRALGILTAGAALDVLRTAQFDALIAGLRTIKSV